MAKFHPPEFRLVLRRADETVVVEVHGELDHLNARRLVQAVTDSLVDSDLRAVVLDLHRCDFLDSCGVAALVDVAAAVTRGRLALAALSKPARRVLDRIDLGDAASSYSSVDLALAELRR